MPRASYLLTVTDGCGSTVRYRLEIRPLAALAALILTAPCALALYVGLMAQARINELTAQNARLRLASTADRTAAGRLHAQLPALRTSVADLAERIDVDPALRASIDRLPDATRNVAKRPDWTELAGAGDVLARLHGTLGSVRDMLQAVALGVAHGEALADATPIIWPADGWISAEYGYRSDPFTGQRDFHPAVDISTRKGQPVYATATGRVTVAARTGAYGNLVEIDHGFGLATRYGHLSEFVVAAGDTVLRGDVIGAVGATGRATGHHVHYEVRADGRTINPRRLLLDPRRAAAD